jgi:DNA polymerase I-like protein with 3'-5' exonuclease and polymerase domains
LKIIDGAMAKKVAKTAGCTIEEAEEMLYQYHRILYPGNTSFKEDYVLPTAKEKGWIHLNWGLRLYTDNPDKDVRTLFNANFQSYTVLTQIAGVKFREKIIKDNLQDRIKAVSIIHDSLTYEIDDDPKLIEYVNNNLIKLMTENFVTNQVVKLHAEIDMGYNMANMITLPNNATIEKIQELKNTLHKKE